MPFLSASFVMILLLTSNARGQCDSLIQVHTADSGYSWAPIVDSGEVDSSFVQSPDDYSAHFNFNYIAYSSQTVWKFSEFFLNRRKLFLAHWCFCREVNWDTTNSEPITIWSPAQIRAKSTTLAFPIQGGDTLQFYRSLSWVDRLTNSLSFNRYVNEHGLSYSVELINLSTLSRVMLLDTFNIAPTTSSKKPCIYSWYPMMSRVRQIVPSYQDSINAFVRVNVWTSGANAEPFMRYDGFGFNMSATHLSSNAWTYYNDSVQVNSACSSSSNCVVTMGTTSSPRGFNISHGSLNNVNQIKVCNIFGTVIWSSSAPLPVSPIFVGLATSGLYIVIELVDDSVVCTQQLFVP